MSVARLRRTQGDALLRAWGVVVLIFLFLPIVVIVIYSFNSGRTLQTWEGFGVDAYVTALSNPAITASLGVSLVTSLGAALVATVLGTMGGMALARDPGRWGAALLGLLGFVLVTPEIVNAISLLPWFVTLGVDWSLPFFNLGLTRLVVANSVLGAALVTLVVRARMAGTDASLEEAAADLYAPPWRRFVDVTLPLIRPAVLSGALLAFTLSLDNTVVSSFVSVAGSTPWPVYVFASLKTGLRPEIAAASTVMLLFTLVVIAIVGMILRRDPTGSKSGSADLTKALVG